LIPKNSLAIRQKIYKLLDAELANHPLMQDQRPKLFQLMWKMYLQTGRIHVLELERTPARESK
jgi:hypothetical protein